MTDRTRSTLRLRLPPTSVPVARPASSATASGTVYVPPPSTRPAGYGPSRAASFPQRPMAPIGPLDACSQAIMDELAALGLAEPAEG